MNCIFHTFLSRGVMESEPPHISCIFNITNIFKTKSQNTITKYLIAILMLLPSALVQILNLISMELPWNSHNKYSKVDLDEPLRGF